MLERRVTLAQLFLIAGTRVALGMGIGLLLGRRLSRDQGKAVGVALTVVGAATTVPLVMGIIGKEGRLSKLAA